VTAAIRRSGDARLLNDLGAAYCVRGRQRSDDRDLHSSLEALERSFRLRRTPETAWNRAMCIEYLHDRDDARNAWREYLSLDATSPWAVEVRAHLADLAKPTDSMLWTR
jgi:Flp pilus assembly protein TadD